MQQSTQSKMEKASQLYQRQQQIQQPNKLLKQDFNQNKENNSHLTENHNRLQNRELQQSALLEVRGRGEGILEEEQLLKMMAKESRSNQKQNNQNRHKMQDQKFQKMGAAFQLPQQQETGFPNESMINKNIMNSGSISSSFCIPQVAQSHVLSQQMPSSQQQQQIISINNSDFLIGSLQQSNYMNNVNETLDSNGNEIRGRKIDSPHLLVVREIREMEEEEDREMNEDQMHGFGSGSDDLINLIWNSRDLRQQANNVLNESLKKQGAGGKQQQKHSKSLESKGFRQQKINSKFQQPQYSKNDILMGDMNKFGGSKKMNQQHSNSTNKYNNQNNNHNNNNQRGGASSGVGISGGTKSQRELRSSMGFNELLNQLDKDVSVNQVNINDFKNRTVHDLLKLELSGIRRQYSQGGNKGLKNDLKSKSIGKQIQNQPSNKHSLKVKRSTQQEIKGNSAGVAGGPTRSKSREAKKNENKQQFGISDSNIIKKAEIDKLMSMIKTQTNKIQQQQQQQQDNLQNGRTKSQSSLAASGSGHLKNINTLIAQQKMNVFPSHQNINSINNNNNNQINQSRVQKDQSSPDRRDYTNINNGTNYKVNNNNCGAGGAAAGNIDKLVRENIKKNREKEDEERFQKQKYDETIKKKKEDLEKKNSQVRIINKQKTYKKNQDGQAIMQQQSQDPIGQSQGESAGITNKISNNNNNNNNVTGGGNKIILRKDWKEQIQIFNHFKMDYPNKSQSQKLDFDKIRGQQQNKENKEKTFKNHRKSYGLEFIDIKKEIEQEMRTIDIKMKTGNLINGVVNNSLIKNNRNTRMNDFANSNANNTESSIKKLKIKSNSKQQQQQPFNYEADKIASEKDIIFKKGFDQENPKKVVVIKKNKIRKFMKAKKKEHIQQQWQEHNQEISRTIKMQENLLKLNQFCKKNLDKQTVQKNIRKRNTTIQGGALTTDPDQSKQMTQDRGFKVGSKQGRRKKDSQNRTGQKSQKKKRRDYQGVGDLDEEVGDSSKLSTEFYEEYFRLLNSIKKEQQESNSKIILSEADLSGSNFTQLQRQLLKSPQTKASNKTMQENSSRSPSSFQFNLQQHNNIAPLHPDEELFQLNQRRYAETQLYNQQLQQQEEDDEEEQLQQQLLYNNEDEEPQYYQVENDNNNDDEEEEDDQQQQQQYSQVLEHEDQQYIEDEDDEEDNDQQDDDDEQDEEDDGDYQTQILDVNTVQQLGTFERLQHIEDLDNVGGIDDQDDSDFEEEDGDNQLIIINQQTIGGDENKIIYMSNINSCSLPQTPKEEQIATNTVQHQKKANEIVHKVFEYQPRGGEGQQIDDVLESPQYSNFEFDSNILNQQQQQEEEQLQQFNNKILKQDNKQYKRNDANNNNREEEKIAKSSSTVAQIDKSKRKFELNLDSGDSTSMVPKNVKISVDEVQTNKENYEMRMFTGSESLLREFKLHTPKSSNPIINGQQQQQQEQSNQKSLSVNGMSSQHSQNSMNLNNLPNFNQFSVESRKSASNVLNENTSQSSQSLFDRNSFQQFTMTKLNQIIQNNEFSNLINMRSKALEYRQKKESKFIKKMLKNNQLSPRTYNYKKEQLEKWVQVEQEEIQKTKKAFQEEWQKTVQMIEDTQKNVDQMRQTMKISIENNKHHQGIFNSQSSRNSSSNQSNIPVKINTNIEEGQLGLHLAIAGAAGSSSAMNSQGFGELAPPLSQRSWKGLNERSFNKQEAQGKQKDNQSSDNIKIGGGDKSKKIEIEGIKDENLFDFLEENWQKQKSSISPMVDSQNIGASMSKDLLALSQPQIISQQHFHQQNKPITNERVSRQGIYIEDQNEKIQSSEISDTEFEEKGLIESQKVQKFLKEKQQMDANQEEERSLHRSRSEQDLKELIRNNKLDDNDLYYGDEDFDEIEPEIMQQQLQFGQSTHTPAAVLEQSQKLQIPKQGQIVIEENNFDENEVNSQNFYKNINDLESNDSYLNESDLNKYFQDQQFSIEDFKSLDKKKLIERHEEEEVKQDEEETARLMRRQDDDEVSDDLKKITDNLNDKSSNNNINSKEQQQNKSESFKINKQIIFQDEDIHKLVGDISESMNVNHFVDTDQMSDLQQQHPFFVHSIEYQKNRPAHTPDLQQSSLQQQALLFSNAKPGENIRIADILKKTQSFNGGAGGLDSMNSFMNDSLINTQNQNINNNNNNNNNNSQSQYLFQNQQINQSMNTINQPSIMPPQIDQYATLVNQITEELLTQILQQSLTIPQRSLEQQQIMLEQQQQQILHQQQQQQELQAQQLMPQNQLENQDIFIIDAQLNEREQRREQIEMRQRQLIEADLQKVEIYSNEIIGTLLQSELQALTYQGNSQANNTSASLDFVNYHRLFLNVLTNPIKKNELDILNQLQTSEIGSYEHFETTIDQSAFPILPIDLYLEIERQREEQLLQVNGGVVGGNNNVTTSDNNLESSIIQESIHIHNKAVFDALNESLMKFRPYGLQGEPMPWSNKNRRLQTRVDANSVDTERLFQMVKQDVLRWVATYSGCQPSPVFVFRKTNLNQNTSNPQIRALLGEQEMFDEEQFQETRERRLAQMLASEVVETEHQWLNYEFEEAQVKVDLSDMILEHLVEEVVMFLNGKKEGLQI